MSISLLEFPNHEKESIGHTFVFVYRKLHNDFHKLTTPFEIQISSELNRDLAHLICAMDRVDQVLDEINDPEFRKYLQEQLVTFLAESDVPLGLLPKQLGSPELSSRLSCLRNVISKRQVQREFCQTITTIFQFAEGKRTATTNRKMIDNLIQEWRETARLPVLLMGSSSTHKFESFSIFAAKRCPRST